LAYLSLRVTLCHFGIWRFLALIGTRILLTALFFSDMVNVSSPAGTYILFLRRSFYEKDHRCFRSSGGIFLVSIRPHRKSPMTLPPAPLRKTTSSHRSTLPLLPVNKPKPSRAKGFLGLLAEQCSVAVLGRLLALLVVLLLENLVAR
jgi:hypothetical protein